MLDVVENVCSYSDNQSFSIEVFKAHSDFSGLKTMTDEEVRVFNRDEIDGLDLAHLVADFLERCWR